MRIIKIKEYLDLCLKEKSFIPERQVILATRLEELEHKNQEIEEAIHYVKWK